MNLIKSLIFATLCAFAFSACASNGDIATLEVLYYEGKSAEDSYSYAKKYADDDFLWALQSGILAYQIGDIENANEFLNNAEIFFEGTSGENAFSSGFKSFASILISNGMFEYIGAFYESIFVNHYKALNAIMSGDYQGARVEFNRANDRQRRAKDYFVDYIAKRDESINESNSEYGEKTQNVNLQKSYSQATSIYGTHYQNLRRYRAFEGYVNPYISYVSGIFFLTQRDFSKAEDLLKESYAITNNAEILKDVKILQTRKSRLIAEGGEFYTWIIIEEGRIPKIEEIRFDLPLFFLNAGVLSFNIALPILRESYPYSTSYSVKNAKSKGVSAFEVADISPLVSNEFEIKLPYIITTSLLSSSYKAYLQYLLSEKLGFLGTLGGALFSYFSTNADVRSARILPLRFYALRVSNKNGDFALHNGSLKLHDFTLEQDNECKTLCVNSDNIIYLRIIQNDIISILIHSLKEQKNEYID